MRGARNDDKAFSIVPSSEVLYNVILNGEAVKTTSKGECCSHACMAITEPKRLGLAPSSEVFK